MSTLRIRTQAMRQPRPTCVLVALSVLTLLVATHSGGQEVFTNYVFTNQGGLALGLAVERTNYLTGEAVMVSALVSNWATAPRWLSWQTRDPCAAGFCKLWVSDARSGTTVPCVGRPEVRSSGRGSDFSSRGSDQINADLMKGFGLTNPGCYSVRAFGQFPCLQPPTGFLMLTTPPVLITISAPAIERGAVPSDKR